ncbi:MAG: hypothetical protein HYR96_14790 [Deltaproteobacteria bacterium]|nr:hypothetical protein [Deltaproteobacteria bacterium]MBI3295767.1 hypothetical protein [Deltaproteobacteria bacterium]
MPTHTKYSQVTAILAICVLVALSGCGFRFPSQLGSAAGGNGSTGSGSGNGSGGGGAIGGDPNSPSSYFANTVALSFQAQCTSCHNDPRFGGSGGLTIYSYDKMVAQLLNGSSPDTNSLMSRMRNQIAHTGGDVCSGSSNNSPCFEVKIWWAKEVASRGGVTSSSPIGQITLMTNRGQVLGWAVDIGAQTSPVVINFYIDGPKGTGTLIGSTTANLATPPSGFSGNHGFNFQIPAAYRNGTNHTLFTDAPSLSGGTASVLSKSPYNYLLYSPTTAGTNYFNNTVKNGIGSCLTCHSTFNDYESMYYDHLSLPAKNQGGSATNNLLVIKGNGGNSHGGGNVCGGGAPCTLFQTWWAMEFP